MNIATISPRIKRIFFDRSDPTDPTDSFRLPVLVVRGGLTILEIVFRRLGGDSLGVSWERTWVMCRSRLGIEMDRAARNRDVVWMDMLEIDLDSRKRMVTGSSSEIPNWR